MGENDRPAPSEQDDWNAGGLLPGSVASHTEVSNDGNTTTYEHHEVGVSPGIYSGYTLTVDRTGPDDVSAGLGGAQNPTQWNLQSMGQTVTWLNDMHTYLNGLYRKMPEILELTGRTTQSSHFGTYTSATQLWQKHKTLYDSIITMMETALANLQDASTATTTVQNNYQSGEERNHANAAAVEKAFTDASEANGNNTNTSGSNPGTDTSGSGY